METTASPPSISALFFSSCVATKNAFSKSFCPTEYSPHQNPQSVLRSDIKALFFISSISALYLFTSSLKVLLKMPLLET